MTTTQIAEVVHEVNRAYCQSIGDFSLPSWQDAPEWQKSTVIKGVEFHIANPLAGPDESHKSWLKHKEEEGWKWGPEKDGNKKEHPCFVPYNQLPREQQSKDYLCRQIVHSLKNYING